jgi:16S rRNA processing protein RimM
LTEPGQPNADAAVGPARAASRGAPAGIPAGRVGRPHGLDGSFHVTRARGRMLALGGVVTVAGRTLAIVRRAGTEQRPIVRLEGMRDRADAEALRGAELTVPASEALVLGEGEWWAHELEGCEVRDGRRLLGTVSRLIELPSCEALEVAPAGGGPALLVPLVKDAIRRVAPAQRRIEVDLEFLDLAGGDSHTPPERAGEEERERGGGA